MSDIAAFTTKDFTLQININGEIDNFNVNSLENIIREQLEKSCATNIILDLKNIKFIDSSFIGMLISLNKYIKSYESRFSIINVSNHVNRILEIAAIDKIIKIVK